MFAFELFWVLNILCNLFIKLYAERFTLFQSACRLPAQNNDPIAQWCFLATVTKAKDVATNTKMVELPHGVKLSQ